MHVGVASVVTRMLDLARLAVVFDLDETLLIANSQSTLSSKIKEAKKNRCGLGKHWACHYGSCP